MHSKRGKYDAFVRFRGKRVHLGLWKAELDAAVARDRGALFFGLETRLNVARISKSLGPASPEELRALAVRKGKAEQNASPYAGVVAKASAKAPQGARWKKRGR